MSDRPADEAPEILAFAQEVLLHGSAQSLQGQMHITNPGAESVQLNKATLRVGEAMNSVPIFGHIPAGQTAAVALNLSLDSTLPAGTYHGEIEAGGVQSRVTIVVDAIARLRFSPGTLTVTEIGSRKVQQTLVITNAGTVPIKLPEKLAIGLTMVEGLSEALHHALRSSGREGFQQAADAATRRLAELEVRPAVLRLGQEPVTLAPGESRAIEVEIQLPSDLRPNKRYTGQTKLYNASLRLVIEAYGNEPQPEEHEQEEAQ